MRLHVLLLAVAIPASVSAQTTGIISGTITNASGGAPLNGASVVLFDGTNTDTVVLTTSTDSSGNYSFASIAPGTYFLRASSTGFVQQVYAGVTCIALDCAVGSGTPITVTAGSSSTANVALVPGGSITGTIRKADGTLVFGLTVSLYNAAGSVVTSGVSPAGDGTYQFTGLAAGTYFAQTRSSNQSPTPDYLDELYGGIVCPVVPQIGPCPIVRGAPITVTAGATTSGIDFALDAPGRITGTVTGVGETVRVGTSVHAYSGSVLIANGQTDSSGVYTIGGLPTGHYTIRTAVETAGANDSQPIDSSNLVDEWYANRCVACGDTPTGVAVTAGATTTIDFELATGGRIGGTLTLAPHPVPRNALTPSVQVFSSAGVLVKSARVIVASGDTVYSWQAAGLPAGTYYVRTASSVAIPNAINPNRPSTGWWVDEIYDNIPCIAADCSVNRGTPVTLAAGGNVTGVNIALDYGATISGGLPIRSFVFAGLVEVYDARGVRLPGRVGETFTGLFTAAGLPAGSYYLKLPRDVAGRYPETLYKDIPCDGCSVTSGTPVPVFAAQSVDGIDFTTLPSRSIRGTVRSSSGTPLSTIAVEIFAQNGAAPGSVSIDPHASAITRADGTYVFPALTPGIYYARTSNHRGFVDVLYGDVACSKCDPLSGTAIVVGAGADTTGIDFSLPAGTVVSGLLTTQLAAATTGHPMSGPTTGSVSGGALLFYRQDGTLAARAITDSLGRFETTLVQGTYDMRLEPMPGLARASRTVTVGSTEVTNADLFVFPANALSISPAQLANAAVGRLYRQTLQASGGSAPITFSITTGPLPPGLSLSTSGVLSGTPTTSGRYTFTVAAEDSIFRHGAREYTLDVPACTFPNPPSPFIAARVGGGHLFGQSCAAVFPVSTDVPWITASRTVFMRPTPLGTTEEVSVQVTIAANTSPEPRRGHLTIGPRVVDVIQSGTATSPPFGFLETPANGAVVSGSVAVSGWALDDTSVTRVAIFRDPVAGEVSATAQVFIGDATFVPGARPDVEAVFPSIATRSRAGWGYLLLTNMLPSGGNGTFNLYAYAVDNHGTSVLLGERTIVGANSTATVPFGTIDTPEQGALVSGQGYVNFGWALTPQPKLIPFDGSTISVVIDGVPVGTLSGYNFARSDVSSLFPGLKNSAGPVGFRMIDTTALSEGLHTIAWVVTDDAGQATGIGSRYFTVQNSAWAPSLKIASRVIPPGFMRSEVAAADATTSVPARIDGVDMGRRTASLASLPLGDDGARVVTLRTVQRLELALPASAETCASTYEGYLSANGELRALPVGSSLDPRGTFYWQPGPAFNGTYHLLFVRTSCDGARERVPVRVAVK